MPDEAVQDPPVTTQSDSPPADTKPDVKPKPKQRNQAIDELRELFSTKPKSEGEDDVGKAKKDDKQVDDAAKEGGTEKPAGEGDTKAKDKTKEGDAKDEKPKKLRKVEQPAPRQVDEEKLAEAVARATAKAIGEQKPVETKPSDDFSDLPKSRRNDIPIYEKLGKKDEFIRFSRAEVRYIDQWEKEHPGEKFDPDADEHETFYSKHEPEIDASEFRQAEIEIAADRIVDKRLKEQLGNTAQELEELRIQQAVAKAEPEMARASNQMIGALADALGPEVLKALSEGGIKKVEEVDPVAAEAINQIGPRAIAVASEAVRLFASKGKRFQFDDPKVQAAYDEIFAEAVTGVIDCERNLLSRSPEELLWDGRPFLTRQKYMALPANERANYWCVGPRELERHFLTKYREAVTETRKKEQERFERYTSTLSKTATNSTVSNNGEHKEEPDDLTEKPNSPSSGTRAAVNPANKTDVKPSKTLGDLIEKAMLGTLR